MAQTTFGDYEILGELGRGAMGVVYEARRIGEGIPVALKVMSAAPNSTPDTLRRQVERFTREARALQRLNHPRIVRLYEQGEVGGRPYFAMEKVRGTNLRDRLQFQGPLSLPELLRLLVEVADALDHSHDRGVVHRDIKPENIMFLPDGGARLMDFGIARLLPDDDPALSGGFQGSPAYMSPEQILQKPVDRRTDIYSLSITLYEAATTRRAFEGGSVPEIAQRVLSEYPPPPPGLPPYVQGALIKAMSKEPAQRYARAGEMAEDIRLGRMPQFTFAPPTPAVPPATPAPPPRYHLGSGAPPSAGAAAVTVLEGPLPVMSGPVPATVGCRNHPGAAAGTACTSCAEPICRACLVERADGVVLCRRCAFGRA